MERLKRLSKRNSSSSSLVGALQGKNKEDNPQNVAVSDKGVQVDPDIIKLQDAWAAAHQVRPEGQEAEDKLGKSGKAGTYQNAHNFYTCFQKSSMRTVRPFPTKSGAVNRTRTLTLHFRRDRSRRIICWLPLHMPTR